VETALLLTKRGSVKQLPLLAKEVGNSSPPRQERKWGVQRGVSPSASFPLAAAGGVLK